MGRVGFAVEKLQGSAWQFTPGEALNAERNIQFHEPHPDSDVPCVMAKRFGRRLGRVSMAGALIRSSSLDDQSGTCIMGRYERSTTGKGEAMNAH
jgi:hypothetical protein